MANAINGDISRFAKKIPPGSEYYGIDRLKDEDRMSAYPPDRARLEYIELFEAQHRAGNYPNIVLGRMDARSMPFPDGFFAEVHMHNVLTAPKMNFSAIWRIAAEASRVLAPYGAAIVTYSRDGDDPMKLYDLDTALEFAMLSPARSQRLEDHTAFAMDISDGYSYGGGFIMVLNRM